MASLGGYALVLFAFRLAPTAYVVAARESSIVMATLYGRFVLAERVREDFTWRAVVRDFEAVYDEVLGLATFTPETPSHAGRR